MTVAPETVSSVSLSMTVPAMVRSSSTIVVVTGSPLAVPLVTESIETTIVSYASAVASATDVSVTVPVVEPAAMTMEVPERV